jgi:hypothetical protein
MSDHEQLHDRREDEADELEHANEQLGEHVDEAKEANEALEHDEFIATPATDEDGPEPEAEYPAKG